MIRIPDEAEVLAEFETAGAIRTGHFILTSGLHSPTYLQCALVMQDPARGERLCAALAAKVQATLPDARFELVVAPAVGGILVGYETARHLRLPAIFAERVEGTFMLRRGFAIRPGTRVLVVEDVISTALSSRECIACVQAAGGEVVAEACLVDRSSGKSDPGVPLVALLSYEVPAYQPDALPSELAALPAEKPGSRDLVSS